VKVRAVFSISHTAVALGISGRVMSIVLKVSRVLPVSVSRGRSPRGRFQRHFAGKAGKLGIWTLACYWVKQGIAAMPKLEGEIRMMFDDEPVPPKPARLVRLPLDHLGVDELALYIDERHRPQAIAPQRRRRIFPQAVM
jgi:hypothetical protein